MTTTLLLDQNWDLTLDASRNLAVVGRPYSTAQDVASAVRLFKGELWYDTTQGVPYFEAILGKLPSLQFIKLQLIAAGLTVPNVARIACFLTGPGRERTIGGQLQITDNDGVVILTETQTLAGFPPWYVNAATSEAVQP